MIKATQHFLILMFWVIGGGLMLSAGEPPLRVLLLLLGVTLMGTAVNRTFARAKARQGKPDDFSLTISDIAKVSRKDWLQLALLSMAGLGLSVSALVAFRGGA